MKHRHSLLRRVLSIALSFAVVLPTSLALVGDSGSAQAAGSKTSISVLAIEGSDLQAIDATDVSDWTGYAQAAISITYTSTRELIGSIEDLAEKYDLIYVGNSVSASGSFSNELPENYIYSNIGAEYQIRNDAVGLTDSEYINSKFTVDGNTYYKLNSTAQQTRYSGNDLSALMLSELSEYAAAGHPVIIADGLTNGDGHSASGAVTLGADITNSKHGYSDTLTVAPVAISGTIPSDAVITYQWYNATWSPWAMWGETASTYISTSNGTFYCMVYYKVNGITYSVKSDTVLINSNGTLTIVGNGDSINLPAYAAAPFTINENYVDNCSNMYTFLGHINDYDNFMCVSDINRPDLLGYIDLSEPEIVLSGYPVKYTGIGGAALTPVDGVFTLEYTFTITNATDTDEEYNCNLYIDSDADGRYRDSELVSGVVLHQGSASGAVVSSGLLTEGNTYVAAYELPLDIAGIIFWKLELVKTTDTGVHTSVSDCTYVPVSSPKTINILQINTGRNSSQTYGSDGNGDDPSWTYDGLPLDTTTGSIPYSITHDHGSDYDAVYYLSQSWTKIYNLLTQISSDYDINIQTVTTADVNNISAVSKLTNRLDGNNVSYEDVTAFLNSYDMVLMGIDNNYNELSEETAEALAIYLENNPILYTHNPSSYNNVPQVYVSSSNTNYSVAAANYFGYYFNAALRNPLGLDRYGVADDEYGHTIMSNPNLTRNGVQATESGIVASNDYTGMDDTQAEALLEAGYSIAYEPGSNTDGTGGTPIVTTQGFSNYYRNEYYPVATQASQVNRGQITSYPFDLNTTDFESGSVIGTYIPLSSTHPLFYQLNMNSDNVVVWYCLNNNDLDYNRYEPNDVTNSYYLYRYGNATYSGFGQNTYTLGDAEAKLFVNTIVAAGSAGSRDTDQVAPEVKFSDSTGNKVVENFLLSADSFSVLTSTDSSDKQRRVYFTVTDTNNDNTKVISASFSFGTESTPITGLAIYNSQTNLPIGSASLVSGEVYYLIINDVWTKMLASDTNVEQEIDSGIPLNVKAMTTIGNDSFSSTATLTLRKFTLFYLS